MKDWLPYTYVMVNLLCLIDTKCLLNQVLKNRHGKLEHRFFTQVSNEVQHAFVICTKLFCNQLKSVSYGSPGETRSDFVFIFHFSIFVLNVLIIITSPFWLSLRHFDFRLRFRFLFFTFPFSFLINFFIFTDLFRFTFQFCFDFSSFVFFVFFSFIFSFCFTFKLYSEKENKT